MVIKVKKFLDTLLLFSGGVCFVVLVISVGYQVFTRYILNNPSTITEELARLGQIYLALIAATYCWGAKKHIAITLILSKLNSKYSRALSIFIEVIICLFIFIGLVIGGGELVISNLQQTTPALGINISLVYLIFPISGVCMIMYSIIHALIHKSQIQHKDSL